MESKTPISSIRKNIGKVMVGSEETINLLLTALIAEGHVLIEDVPGMGKTVLAKSLAKSVSLEFNRIQFTPDLLPSDVIGLNYFDQKANDFVFSPGPAFCNLLLADEINRATPRTQSRPRLSSAWASARSPWTASPVRFRRCFSSSPRQNPIETLGTYLPEAQLDRFLMRISMASPTKEQERAILQRFMKEEPLETLQSVCTREDILALQKQAKEIYIHPVPLDIRSTVQPRAVGRISIWASARAAALRSSVPCALTPWCAAAHTSCRKTSRPSPCRCSPTVW